MNVPGGTRRWLPAVVAVLVGLVLFVVVLWLVPWWLDDHYLTAQLTPEKATLVSGMRTALVALGAGALAVVGLFYTHHTLNVTREGHITDRITKAVEQLGSAVLEVRLGGIYALERIMRDSPTDRHAVVQVLAAFVRTRARNNLLDKPTGDVQAALTVLTVLGRRSQSRARLQPDGIDLSGACLRGAYLAHADLRHANLSETNLE